MAHPVNGKSCLGTEKGMEETFGSTCHGAGRALSRAKSRRNIGFQDVLDKLSNQVSIFFYFKHVFWIQNVEKIILLQFN